MKTDFIRARIEPELKQETEAVLSELGMSISDAVTVFCRQIVLQQGLPFSVRLPNAATQAALAEDLTNAKRYGSAKAMIDSLVSDDD